MSIRHRTVLNSAIHLAVLGVGLLGVTTAALAHRPYWEPAPRYARPTVVAYEPDYVYARVVDVEPLFRQVRVSTPQRDCWVEEREVYSRPGIDASTAAPTVLGAIIGGVVGHQFGSGRGRDAATVAGTVIGASIGHSSAVRAGGTETRAVQRCAVSYEHGWEEQVEGYRVTYVHRGREYTTRMSYDPGSSVRIRVPNAPYGY